MQKDVSKRVKWVSVQFSSVAQSCLTLGNPMNRSTPGLPVHHQLPEFTQTHVHRVGDAIQPFHPLLLKLAGLEAAESTTVALGNLRAPPDPQTHLIRSSACTHQGSALPRARHPDTSQPFEPFSGDPGGGTASVQTTGVQIHLCPLAAGP